MGTDLNTTILILAGTHLIQVLFFLYFYYFTISKSIRGPGWWLMWSISETLAFILILNVIILSFHPLDSIIQGTLLVSGTLFIYLGVMRFFDRKINSKLVITLFIFFFVLHLGFITLKADIARSITVDGSISIISFITAVSLYKYKTKAIRNSANLNAVIGMIHGIIFGSRAIMSLPDLQTINFFSPAISDFVSHTEAFFVGLFWTFGFIIMVNQKLNSELAEAKSHFELIFNASPDAVIISGFNDGLFVDCNETFTKITGYTKKNILGKSSFDISLWNNRNDRDQVIKMLVEKGFCENKEVIFQRKGGELFTVLFTAKIITINEIPHILSYTRDISDLKKIEEEIRLKNEELKTVNLEKDKFFSIIAHDLRNPLSAFLSLSELLVEELPGMTTVELEKIAIDMRDASANLFNLLENLLEWSRINRGLIRFSPESAQLNRLVNESLTTITDYATKKNIGIISNISSDIKVYTDINAFHTILRNLVSNAVKFTPSGGKIFISASQNDAESVEISVKDSGIGMSCEMIDKLFKLDAQINRKGTEGELSTGLGLILCKDFINMHEGRLRIESEEGKGSVFIFTIPNKVS
jgi:PAS domain S-box-containing protein